MLRGLYISASSMVAEQTRNDVVANNLANVNTNGYKKDEVILRSFSDVLVTRINDLDKSGKQRFSAPTLGTIGTGVSVDTITVNHNIGQLKETGRMLDLSIQGEGFFVLSTPQGEKYTRNGHFSTDVNGYLVSPEGYFVQGQHGNIKINREDAAIEPGGRITVDNVLIDTLRIVNVADKENLQKSGDNLFQGGQATEIAIPSIRQGSVESANVNAVTEMINLITIMRSYEASQRIITAEDNLLGKAVNEIAHM